MKIIKSEILSRFPEIVFGMSTTDGGESEGSYKLNLSYNVNDNPLHVAINRKKFFEEMGLSEQKISFTRQRHTANVDSVSLPGIRENCDALLTNSKNLFLAISVADCVPIMLYDPVSSAVAGVHAGWRGTAGRIVEKALLRLSKDFGTLTSDVLAFIGPSAGSCCYEVGREVASQFPGECYTAKENDKYLLDVRRANLLQLVENGVHNSNIEVSQECTIENKLFHSHRRDGAGSGRMLAVIGIKN